VSVQRSSCDSCGKSRPVDCVQTRMAYGCEGDFCCACRGWAPGECDAEGCENVVPARPAPAVGSAQPKE
jgi:hypothetical protein